MNTGPLRAAGAVTLLLLACETHAQCNLTWQLFNVSPIVDVGHNWDPDGPGPATALFAFGGGIVSIPGASAPWIGVASYDPATGTWATYQGLNYEVDALTTDASHRLIAAGGGGLTPPNAGSIDAWTGSSWTNLGKANGYVWSLVTLPNGDLVAGGDFTQVNGVAANHIARFDGSSWSPLGAGLDGRVLSLALMPGGDLVAAGWYAASGGTPTAGGIARWNGTGWLNLVPGSSLLPQFITTIVVMPNGKVFGGGVFVDPATASVNSAARWDGSGWHAVGQAPDGPVVALTALPGGDVIAGGAFQNAGGGSANNVARWNGSSWSPLGPGLGNGPTHQVLTLTTLPNGDVMAGGGFGPAPSSFTSLARLSTSCPASTTSYGAGCVGTAGPLTTSASSAAWIGSVAGATTTGVQPGSTALAIWGFGQLSTPLSAISPIGQSGCVLLVTPDLIAVSTAMASSVSTQIPVPNNPALAGLVLHHQVVLVETPAKLTSGNGLSFTVGVF